MKRLLVQNRADWPAMRLAGGPAPTGAAAEDPDICSQWAGSLYVTTPYSGELAALAHRVEMGNLGVGQCRWIAVDAPTGYGKSELLTRWALSQTVTRRAQRAEGHPRARFDQIPVVWINANKKMYGAGMYSAILRFCGINAGRASETDMRGTLEEVLPRLGVRYIIVDEAHMLRLERQLADTCRGTLSLPVTMIYAGASLQASALLGQASGEGAQASDQMRFRCRELAMPGLSPMRKEHRQGFMRYLIDFATQWTTLAGATAPLLKDESTIRDLHRATEGCAGRVMETLKAAALESLLDKRALCTDLVRANWPTLDERRRE